MGAERKYDLTAKRAADARAFLRRFATDESGVLVAFSVFFMLIILFVGALGVDIIRFEAERTRLQHSLDQAVLAAADLDQKGNPQDVVADYFAKTGVDANLVSVNVESGLSYRTVEASASQEIQTQLLHMLGVDTLAASAYSIAEERAEKVEISLVLDVSTSMQGSKIDALIPAAKDFVTNVLDLSGDGDVSISMVPYSSQVSVSPTLKSQFKVRDTHNYSHCLTFDSDHFTRLSMEPPSSSASGYRQTEHLDPWSTSEDPAGLKNNSAPTPALPVCSTNPAVRLLPLNNDKTALHRYIGNLVALGNTSTEIGIKWGAALLDPSSRSVVNNLITAGEVDSKFSGRPYDLGTGEGLKVIVVMSDGQNAPEFSIAADRNSGNSNVWYNASTDRYALYAGGYYWTQTSSGDYAIPYSYGYYDFFGRYYPPSNRFSTLGTDWQRLTYPQLFAHASLSWVASYIYRNFDYDYWNNWYWGSFTELSATVKDTRMDAICSAAKNEGIVIYAVSYALSTDEDAERGQAQMLSCASSPSFYFNATEVDIAEAFDTIAQSISQLKLTQ